MPWSRRKFPKAVREAEAEIEDWRSKQILGVSRYPFDAIWRLVTVVCEALSVVHDRFIPDRMTRMEIESRKLLFGLQFALHGVQGTLPLGSLDKRIQRSRLAENEAKYAFEVVKAMATYETVRVVFLTYAWHGFDLEDVSGTTLRFVDNPRWPGLRDRACVILSSRVKEESCTHETVLGIPDIERVVTRSLKLPPKVDLGGLDSSEFAKAWIQLIVMFGGYSFSGVVPTLDRRALAAELESRTDLRSNKVARFIDIITFDRQGNPALSLFHCPLVPVTRKTFLLVPAALLLCSLRTTIPRLAVHRGPGLGPYAAAMESQVLSAIQLQFASGSTTLRPRVPYESPSDRGDIDLVVYDGQRKSLAFVEVKAFIPPDTVSEVYSANETIEEGLRQISRIRAWADTLGRNIVLSRLGITDPNGDVEIEYILLTNGFAGSDYLDIPEGVNVVDVRYILLSRFEGESFFTAVTEFQEQLSELMSEGESQSIDETAVLGRFTIIAPGNLIPT